MTTNEDYTSSSSNCGNSTILEMCNMSIIIACLSISAVSCIFSFYQLYAYIRIQRLHKGVIRLIFNENIATIAKSSVTIVYMLVLLETLQSKDLDDDSKGQNATVIILEGLVLIAELWCLIWTVLMAWVINKTVKSMPSIMGLKKLQRGKDSKQFSCPRLACLFTNTGIGWALCSMITVIVLPLHYHFCIKSKYQYLLFCYLPIIVCGNLYILYTLCSLLYSHRKENAVGIRRIDRRDMKIRKIVRVLIWFPVVLLVTSIPNLICLFFWNNKLIHVGSNYWRITFMFYMLQGFLNTFLYFNLPPVYYQMKKERRLILREKESFYFIYLWKYIFLIKNTSNEESVDGMKEDLLSVNTSGYPKSDQINQINYINQTNANLHSGNSDSNSNSHNGNQKDTDIHHSYHHYYNQDYNQNQNNIIMQENQANKSTKRINGNVFSISAGTDEENENNNDLFETEIGRSTDNSNSSDNNSMASNRSVTIVEYLFQNQQEVEQEHRDDPYLEDYMELRR